MVISLNNDKFVLRATPRGFRSIILSDSQEYARPIAAPANIWPTKTVPDLRSPSGLGQHPAQAP